MSKYCFFLLMQLYIPFSGVAQTSGLDFSYRDSYEYIDIDSALVNPEDVKALTIICESNNYLFLMSLLEKEKYRLANLTYISFAYDCDIDTIPSWILGLPNLNTIYSIGPPTIYDIPADSLKLLKVGLACPRNVDPLEWQKKIYKLQNLKILHLDFATSVEIDRSILNLTKLESLAITSQGDIKFPKSISKMENLKNFSISQCTKCESFPDTLPLSLKSISTKNTKVKQLNSNINSLKNLKFIDLSDSDIQYFPEDFNFSQLDYFSAPRDLFSNEKWSEINKSVKTVVIGQDRTSKMEKIPLGKRN